MRGFGSRLESASQKFIIIHRWQLKTLTNLVGLNKDGGWPIQLVRGLLIIVEFLTSHY